MGDRKSGTVHHPFPHRRWQTASRTQLSATVRFALPGNDAVVVSVRRRCDLFLNHGPNGTLGSFDVTPAAQTVAGGKLQPQATGLLPLQRYVVNIKGWEHHSVILYSVWFYWDSNPGSLFRMSIDSASLEHVIVLPAQVSVASPLADALLTYLLLVASIQRFPGLLLCTICSMALVRAHLRSWRAVLHLCISSGSSSAT